MPGEEAMVMDLIFGRWRSQTLYAGVKLGIFDALGEKPKGASAVAQELGLEATLCYRLLRALGCLELLIEDKNRAFSLSQSGQLLQSDHPQTLRGVTLLEEGPEHYALWKHLPEMIREGKQNAFVREFGHMAFDHADQSPAYAEVFNQAMSSYSNAHAVWVLDALANHDLSQFAHLCDVAGGQGHLMCTFLAKYPHLRGTVMDLPNVVENKELLWADRMGVGDRCTYVGGDMFEEIPAADAYTMKMILHDWNDEECVQILSNIRDSASQKGRLFVCEHIVSNPETPHFSKLFDIHMMCWGTGRERTSEEYQALLERSGWTYINTWFPSQGLMGVIEGAKG